MKGIHPFLVSDADVAAQNAVGRLWGITYSRKNRTIDFRHRICKRLRRFPTFRNPTTYFPIS